MLLSRRLVRDESRGLLTLTGIISAAGVTMVCNNFKTNKWKWKNIRINKYTYLLLEIFVHQLPFFYMLKQPPKGNAWKALIPTCLYISIINNPYKINGKKLRNYYGLILVCLTAPIVNSRKRHITPISSDIVYKNHYLLQHKFASIFGFG
tara:strand:+ start:335 stop:784 length:450 start_codon:yes stop_codon:yes gene_type:complete